MDIQFLARFFLWCTVLNGGILLFSFCITMFTSLKEKVYELHGKWFPMSKETFTLAIYLLIGIYKIAIFVFNFIPWVVLTMLQ